MTLQQRAQETRERLLDAAQDCFARRGYDAAGVAEICQQAGVSKGAFYHHFPSKQALFQELMNRWLEGLDAQFTVIRAESGDVAHQLRRMAALMDRVLVEARGQMPLFLEFVSQARHDSLFWQAMVAPHRRYRALFRQMTAAGVADGSLLPADPGVMADALVSMAVGVLLQSLLDPEGTDWGQVARAGVEMLILDG